MSDGTILVVVGTAVEGYRGCKWCGVPLWWATVASAPGRPAATRPFVRRPASLELVESESGVKFERWPADAVHVCPQKPKNTTRRYQQRASRAGQVRMW